MSASGRTGLTVNVIELNPYAPRPFVFTEAALCLRDSIRLAGFDSEVLINQADPRAISVVLGAVPPRSQVVERLDPRKTIVFNFEQFASSSALVDEAYLQWLHGRMVADYHSHNVAWLKRHNGETQQAFALPVVPSRSVAYAAPATPGHPVDVLFFGTLNPRREHLIGRLRGAGMTVQTVAGAYAHELTPALASARLVLHAHFYETGLFPVARMLQPVVQGVPVVCETSVFSAGSDWSQSGLVFAPYEQLVAACAALLRSPAERQERARAAQLFAAQLDFATPFSQMLRLVLTALASGAAVATQGTASRAAPPQGAPAPRPDDGTPLTTLEIEAILAQEAGELPPEAHLVPPPVALAQRQLAQFRLGRWAIAFLAALGLVAAWRSMG